MHGTSQNDCYLSHENYCGYIGEHAPYCSIRTSINEVTLPGTLHFGAMPVSTIHRSTPSQKATIPSQGIRKRIVQKRERPIRSCTHCRARKLKCDKKKPSCSRCCRGKENCVYITNSDDLDKAPKRHVKRRKRQINVCRACRERKIPCDKQNPCSRCLEAGLECAYMDYDPHTPGTDVTSSEQQQQQIFKQTKPAVKVQRLMSPTFLYTNATLHNSHAEQLGRRISHADECQEHFRSGGAYDQGKNFPHHSISVPQIDQYEYPNVWYPEWMSLHSHYGTYTHDSYDMNTTSIPSHQNQTLRAKHVLQQVEADSYPNIPSYDYGSINAQSYYPPLHSQQLPSLHNMMNSAKLRLQHPLPAPTYGHSAPYDNFSTLPSTTRWQPHSIENVAYTPAVAAMKQSPGRESHMYDFGVKHEG